MSAVSKLDVSILAAMVKQYHAIARLQRMVLPTAPEADKTALMQDMQAMTDALEKAIATMEKQANVQSG